MALSEEAKAIRARMDAEDTGRAIWRGTRPLTDSRLGARTIGSLAEVAPGSCAVWTDVEKRRTSHDEGLGGMVLEIIDLGRVVDEETGEVSLTRAFRCYDPIAPWWAAFRTVREDEVSQDGVELVASNRIVVAIRRFCREISGGKGLLTTTEARLLHDAMTLAKAVMVE